MSDNKSIVNLGELSRPATILIERISDAVGGLCRPYQIKRLAKAEAEAEVIRAQAQIRITDLQRRAVVRWIREEARRQDNMEKIVARAIPELQESAAPQNIENDWIANFFDKCRIVSDEEMQTLWAKVLSGEANSPGKYSSRTVNLLGSLDKADARLFTSLCGFAWTVDEVQPLIFDTHDSIYTSRGIDFAALNHLDDIGLTRFNSITGFIREISSQQLRVLYYGTALLLDWREQTERRLKVGAVILTKAGQQLCPICAAKPVDGFYEYVVREFAVQGIGVQREN